MISGPAAPAPKPIQTVLPSSCSIPTPPVLYHHTSFSMLSSRSAVTTVAGTICVLLGAAGTLRFGVSLLSGSVDVVDFSPVLLPLGIALLDGNRFWAWVARMHLFILALLSSSTILIFLLMSEESRSITFELSDNIGRVSGGGVILLTQGLFLAAILWIYFAIFAGPTRSNS